MKLNTKLFRPRVSIWAGFGGAVVFSGLAIRLLIGKLTGEIRSTDYTAVILISLLCPAFVVGFTNVGVAALRNYRNQYMSFDKARLKRKGFRPKLDVIGDWFTS